MAKAKEALRGLRGGRFWLITSNTSTEYTTGAMVMLVGAQSLSRADTRQDIRIDADDDIYSQENDLQYTEYTLQLAELPLEIEATLGGHTYDETEQRITYNVLDQASEVAFAYASLKLDKNYRMFTHYCVKLTEISCDLATKGESGDILPYTLTFRSQTRRADGNWGKTQDSTDGTYALLDTIDQIQETP